MDADPTGMFHIPFGLRPSAIPVTLVCGPPAAGKTTYVNDRAAPGDTVIDLDQCLVAVGGRAWDDNRDTWKRALRYRDQLLRGLQSKRSGRAFVVVGAPTRTEQAAWRQALGAQSVVVIATPAPVCLQRLARDPDRRHALDRLSQVVQEWHQKHSNQ